MNEAIFWIIICMAVVTYIPRMLPLVFLNGESLHPRLQWMLNHLPYALLGALIFPGIFTVHQSDIWFGLIGALAAFTIAYFGANLVWVILISILVLTLYLII